MRIRSIKPEFYTSDVIAELTIEEAFCFQGLWVYCDDEGRGKDDPRLVKAALYPLRDQVTASTVEQWLEALTRKGRIIRYAVDGRRYLVVRNFREHQKPNRPVESKLPPPPEASSEGAVREQGAHTAVVVVGEEIGVGEEREKEHGRSAVPREAAVREEFEEAWRAYPRKPNNPHGKALKAYIARRKAGVTAQELLAGVRAYAAFVEAEGTDPKFIKQGATFFGPDEHWDPANYQRQRKLSPGERVLELSRKTLGLDGEDAA